MGTYAGSCFCGAVKLEVTGDPVAQGYCHCESCRSWSGGPVNAFSLWKPQSVRVTSGAVCFGVFFLFVWCYRQFCKSCGGHLMTRHPQWDLVDVFAATIPAFPHQAGVHVNYGETVLRIKDGLPKMKDLPREMGGSGDMVAE